MGQFGGAGAQFLVNIYGGKRGRGMRRDPRLGTALRHQGAAIARPLKLLALCCLCRLT